MNDAPSLADLAADVLALEPHSTKAQWGRMLDDLAAQTADEDVQAEVEAKKVIALGAYVAGVKSAQEKSRQAQRLLDRGISFSGRPMTPMLSIRTDEGAHQLTLWLEATPSQYIDAVLREQKVIDGRGDSNRVRLHIVDMLQEDESLMELACLRDVCDQLSVDPDTLLLEELG